MTLDDLAPRVERTLRALSVPDCSPVVVDAAAGGGGGAGRSRR